MTSPAGGASAGSNGDAGGDAQQDGAQASGQDFGALADQLGQVNATQEEMRQFLLSQPWTQQADEGAEAPAEGNDGLDLSFLDDAGYDQQAAQQLAGVFEAQVQKQVEAAKREMEQRFNSVNERVTERERMEQMRDLVEEFPDMANPDVAKQVVQQAHELVQANGWPTEFAADPRAWRLVYAAQQAFAAAQDEGSDDSDAAHLEGGAGAASAGGQRGDDFTQMLDAAAQGGRSVLPFP